MWSNQENRVRKQVKNPCEARKIKASQILHKIISTHLLTVLTMRVIVQTEQKKRNKKTGFRILSFHLLTTLETTSRVLMAAVKTAHKNFNLMFQHERRNDL